MRSVREITEEEYLLNSVEGLDEILKINISSPKWLNKSSSEYYFKLSELTLLKEEYDRNFYPQKKRCAEAWQEYAPIDRWIKKELISNNLEAEFYYIPIDFLLKSFACYSPRCTNESEEFNYFTSFWLKDEFGRVQLNWGKTRFNKLLEAWIDGRINDNYLVPVLNLNNLKINESYIVRSQLQQIKQIAIKDYSLALFKFREFAPWLTGKVATEVYESNLLKKQQTEIAKEIQFFCFTQSFLPKKEAEIIKSEIIKSTPKYSGIIYRGLKFYLFSEWQNFINLHKNGFIALKKITSFSSAKEVAERYTQGRNYSALIIIEANKSGIDISLINPFEKEILVPGGTIYKVLSLSGTDKHFEILLEEIV